MDRYFVDERGGCIAVRDSNHTDPDYQGLHSDTTGVVRYWDGVQTSVICRECGHKKSTSWNIAEHVRKEAQDACDELNAQATSEKGEEG